MAGTGGSGQSQATVSANLLPVSTMRFHSLLVPVLALGLAACATSTRERSLRLEDLGALSAPRAAEALEQALTEADRALAAGVATKANQQAYQAATEKVVALWLARRDEAGGALKSGSAYRLETDWPGHLHFDELIPARTIRGEQLKRRITRDGVGVPYVAHWGSTPERRQREPFMTEGGYLSSTTATLEFRPQGGGARLARLVLHDPRVVTEVQLAGRRHPLAADLSAYGEYILARKQWQMAGIMALLHSDQHLDKLGLIALEQPIPGRIPLVLVHGLMSRPATWENVVNELGADPVLQKHYQVYLFRYPSGVPIVYSAARLREHLEKLFATLEAVQPSRQHRQMVLIGHSMGGLVSRTQIQDSGDRIWEEVLGATPEKLDLSKTQYEGLRDYLEFQSNPSVSRVIFAATPHRGSDVADSWIADIGRRLVSLPRQALGGTFATLQTVGVRNSALAQLLAKGVPTSVDNLSPESPFMKISNTLPFRKGVRLHSIIGNKDGLPLDDPKCSDGFVPYRSAHLDNVESELVLRSDHSVHERPEAVEEMRRILRLHLRRLGLN